MKKIALAVLAVAALLSPAIAKDVPASPTTYVHNEGILTAQGAAEVSKMLANFEKATGHQMVVAAFQSLDGDNLEGYTNKVFKTWKIGDKKRNDGILFVMFKGDRKWRVEVGYGFEGQLTDLQAYDIATAAAVPSFRKGDFDGGVKAVVSALQSATQPRGSLSAAQTVAPVAAVAAVGVGSIAAAESGIPGWLIIIGIIALIAFFIWLIYITDGDILSGIGSGGGFSSGGGSDSGGGFSGGGGSSGGGGASGGW